MLEFRLLTSETFFVLVLGLCWNIVRKFFITPFRFTCAKIWKTFKKEHWPLFPQTKHTHKACRSLTSLKERRSLLCNKWFSSIVSSESHKLRNLLPPLQEDNYNIRNKRLFSIPMIRTVRFKRTFIPSMCTNFSMMCTNAAALVRKILISPL